MPLAKPLYLVAAIVTFAGSVACLTDRHDFGITPRAPTPTATVRPAPVTQMQGPNPTPTRTPAPRTLYVARSGRDGIILRASPGEGERLGGLTDGIRVIPLGDEETVNGRVWMRVRDQDGRVGWIAAEFTTATPPAPSPTPTPTVRPISTPKPASPKN